MSVVNIPIKIMKQNGEQQVSSSPGGASMNDRNETSRLQSEPRRDSFSHRTPSPSEAFFRNRNRAPPGFPDFPSFTDFPEMDGMGAHIPPPDYDPFISNTGSLRSRMSGRPMFTDLMRELDNMTMNNSSARNSPIPDRRSFMGRESPIMHRKFETMNASQPQKSPSPPVVQQTASQRQSPVEVKVVDSQKNNQSNIDANNQQKKEENEKKANEVENNQMEEVKETEPEKHEEPKNEENEKNDNEENPKNENKKSKKIQRQQSIVDFNTKTIERLDKIDVKVGLLRKTTQEMEIMKHAILKELGEISMHSNMLKLKECDREEIEAITESLLKRTNTVQASVETPRNEEQQKALQDANKMIAEAEELMKSNLDKAKLCIETYLNACATEETSGAVSQNFLRVVIQCTVEDQKRIKSRLTMLLENINSAQFVSQKLCQD